MAESPLAKKLGIKPGHQVRLLNPPDGYAAGLELLPEGATLLRDATEPADVVQLFVRDRDALGRELGAAAQVAKPGGVLWIAFPKRTSRVQTDLTRDAGWEAVHEAGWEGVSLVSLDDVWSAFRFRRRAGAPHTDVDLLETQYAGAKAALRPIYDRLAEAAGRLGPDVTLSVRKTYVSLVRKRQFGIVQASTNTRVDLGLKLKETVPSERLVEAGSFGSGSVTHRIALTAPEAVDAEVIGWMQRAYEAAG